jgi:hypothetical protein
MLRLIIQGGVNDTGVTVEPLVLNYGRIAEYFQIYGLSLARSGVCSEAVQISEALIKNVSADEIAVYNAGEIVNICNGTSE